MGNSSRSRSIAEFEITKRYRCIRTTECNRATIFLSPPFLARKRKKRVRKDRFAISASASGSTKRSHLVDGVGRETVIDRYRVVISSNAIEVFRNDVVCFSSILRVSYRKLRRRKYPPIHGEDFKMGSPFGRAWEGWLEDGK